MSRTLTQHDLQTLDRPQKSDQRIAVWSSDDVSPASYMLSYKTANAVFNWTPHATSRLLASGTEAGVVVHADQTFLHVREGGRYISHFSDNSNKARIRSFTGETIPISVHGQHGDSLFMQDLLIDVFTLMHNFLNFSTGPSQAPSLHETLTKTKLDVQQMSGSDEVVRELQVKGLACFTAYSNRAIKVVFDDRTIVRMQHGQELIKVLTR